MSSKIKKTRGFSELPLFRSVTLFANDLVPIILNINKDIKISMGYDLIKTCVEVLKNLRRGYANIDKDTKIKYLDESLNKLYDIEFLLKFMSDLSFLTVKQSANLSIKIADIITQILSWKANLQKNNE